MTIYAITLLPIAMLLALALAVLGTISIQARRARRDPTKATPREVYRV